jgi:hypothetical protein
LERRAYRDWHTGFVGAGAVVHHRAGIDRMIDVIIGELNRPGAFDLGKRRFVEVVRDQGMDVAADQAAWREILQRLKIDYAPAARSLSDDRAQISPLAIQGS